MLRKFRREKKLFLKIASVTVVDFYSDTKLYLHVTSDILLVH